MRTTPLALGLIALLATSCGGAGRPDADAIFQRLNNAGVQCKAQDVRLVLPSGGSTESSCLTPDGKEIGLQPYADEAKQKALLDRVEQALADSAFPTVVYDYGYIMFVPDTGLGRRVAQVMDAQSYTSTFVRPCPTARGGVCPT